ncbi:hypothetical protein THIOM_002886 [Candidatus Thiomargarita nelsonii]|uniref:Uncharacterized protein n=1 Tax=Candidatus Thiomargarita nelsonii TaxID=1003181 RepID=A0A176S0B4_9GAMM|nr:hypothetical protein THIOM_002886 [Candidatus Thiomargarita nelsonii]
MFREWSGADFPKHSAGGRKFSGHPLVQRIWGINGLFIENYPFIPRIRCTRWYGDFRPPVLVNGIDM